MKATNLDPDSHLINPYSPELLPPADLAELRRLGIFPSDRASPSKEEDRIHIQFKLPSAQVFAIDRMVERRLFRMNSRQDVMRAAIANFLITYVDEIQQGHVRLLINRLAELRKLQAELRLQTDMQEAVETSLKTTKGFLASGDIMGAIRTLRTMKRIIEDVPYPGLKDRLETKMYGSKDGVERPEHWAESEVASLWDRVMDGELDVDDEELIAQRVKLS